MDVIMDFLYTRVIPPLLVMVMAGLGLSLTMPDLKRVIVYPKAAAIGLVGQLILLPLLAFVLAYFLAPTPEIAVGAVILAACPGGVTSNAYVFAARADLALSVTLTATASFITVFTIPLLTYLAMQFFIQAGAQPDLPTANIFRTLVMLSVIPVAAGMTVRWLWPSVADRLVEKLRRITVGFLMMIIVAAAISSYEIILDNVLQAGLLVLALNLLSMGMGYGLGRSFKLPTAQAITLTYEIGVQNLTLALLVTLTLIGNQQLAITTLLYAVIMPSTALALIAVSHRVLAADTARPA
jgi:BASS family bile acid:Na+ symporter